MLIKHGKSPEAPGTLPRFGVVVLFGCFVLLFCCQSRGQDQLLREYIYLDGRLLAVERQSSPVMVRQIDGDEDKDWSSASVGYVPADGTGLILSVDTHGIFLSDLQQAGQVLYGNFPETQVSRIAAVPDREPVVSAP